MGEKKFVHAVDETKMLQEERQSLFGKSAASTNAAALCLSGGGIRSATFCLGVMQGLARAEKLQDFHYLSTVSGGGYAGSWLSRWRYEGDDFSWNKLFAGDSSDNIGDGLSIDPVRRLRSYSNYMSPTWGISLDSLTVLTIFIRNFVFNLAVWIPLILALATVPYFLTSLFVAASHVPFFDSLRLPLTSNMIVFGLPGVFGGFWLLLSLIVFFGFGFTEVSREKISLWAAFAALLALVWLLLFGVMIYLPFFMEINASGIFGAFSDKLDVNGETALGIGGGAFATLVGFIGYWSRNGSRIKREAQGLLDKLGSQMFNLLGAFAVVIIAVTGASTTHTLLGEILERTEIVATATSNAEKNTRNAETKARNAVSKAKAAATAAEEARVNAKVADAKVADANEKADPDSQKILKENAEAKKADGKAKAEVERTKFDAERAMSAMSNMVYPPISERLWLDAKPKYTYLMATTGLLIALLALAWFISFFVGANRFSLHALYGNRLTRAYLGAARRTRVSDQNTDFSPTDDIAMADLLESQIDTKSVKRPRLFHIVNMTLNLTRSATNRRDWQERKAASFSATPLHCGSARTGYAPTNRYGGEAGGLTLGRAMAISGAAATPNMGYHSAPFVTMVMTFLNVRLGWWLPNPDSAPEQAEKEEPTKSFWHIVKEALSFTDDKSDWMYLSDGGHFDNLGLYEMIRRRCHRIILIDGTCDGEFKHSDLHNAIRKVQVDFGVRIDLPPTLPGQAGPGEKQRVVIGRIRYDLLDPQLSAGEIFCVKPILNGEEPPALTHYAETSQSGGQTFPHHSTLDQFFNETQFESYRLLGEVTAEDLCKAIESSDQPASALVKLDNSLEASIEEVRAAYPVLTASAKLFSLAERRGLVSKDMLAIEANPPPAAARGWEGVVAAVQAMSAAKLVASTVITAGLVGGALTVGGEVALKTGQAIGIKPVEVKVAPVEMNFSKEAKDLLETGLKIDANSFDSTLLKTVIGQLEKQVERLQGIKLGEIPAIPVDPNLAIQITRLSGEIERLKTVTGQPIVMPPNLKEQLDTLSVEIIAGIKGEDKPNLLKILAELKSLDKQVKRISPLQNLPGR